MGYALLWVENLAVSLLLVATLVAVVCHRSERPVWKWVHHVAPPIMLLLVTGAGFWAWSEIAMDHFLDRFDPFALALLWLMVVGLAWLLFPLWSQRAAIKVSLKHGFRLWGPPVLALLVVYAGVGFLFFLLEVAGVLSEGWLYLILAVTIALMVALVWLLMRKTQPWAKIGLPLVGIALPAVTVMAGSLEKSTASWFWSAAILTTFVGVLLLWSIRGDMARGLRIAFVGLVILLLTGVCVATTWVAGKIESVHSVPGVWFHALCLLTILFVVGAIWTASVGFRRREAGAAETRAARWPRGRLAVALAVAVALHLMTFWNLDVGVRQRLATLRVEASSLALSLAPARLPDRENAATVYYQAFDAMDLPLVRSTLLELRWFEWQRDTEAPFDPHDDELRQFLETQAPALALFREAAKRPGCRFDHDYSRPSFFMPLPEAQEMVIGAQLLAIDARCKAANGDLRGGLENVNVMFAMAEHLAAEPLMALMLTAADIDGRATRTLQIVLAAGKPTTEDLATVRVSSDLSYRRLPDRVLRMDEAFGLAFFCDMGIGRHDPKDLWGISESDGWAISLARRVKIHRVFFLDADLAAYRELVRKNRGFVSSVSPAEIDEQRKQLNLGTVSERSNSITGLIAPPGSSLVKVAARADAYRGLARLGLAAYRYRAQHDRSPEDLTDLTPEYITLVPRDPFDGKPLKQTTTDDGTLILYSIGFDLVDDGGTPYDDEDWTGDLIFELPKPIRQGEP